MTYLGFKNCYLLKYDYFYGLIAVKIQLKFYICIFYVLCTCILLSSKGVPSASELGNAGTSSLFLIKTVAL